MEFHKFRIAYEEVKRKNPQILREIGHHGKMAGYQDFYNQNALGTQYVAENNLHEAASSHNQGLYEWRWLDLKRPTVQIWPGVVEPLLRLDLDKVQADSIELPPLLPDNREPRVLMFVFAKGENCIAFDDENGTHELRAIMAEWHSATGEIDPGFSPIVDVSKLSGALTIYMDWGEVGPYELPIHSYQKLPLVDTSLLFTLNNIPQYPSTNEGLIVPQDKQEDALKVVSMCCLMTVGELILPDVLSKDRRKFDETGLQKYVDKAHRRGKYVWNIGIDGGRGHGHGVSTHWRNSHPCMVWYGPGKKKCKVIMRKGSWINPDKK